MSPPLSAGSISAAQIAAVATAPVIAIRGVRRGPRRRLGFCARCSQARRARAVAAALGPGTSALNSLISSSSFIGCEPLVELAGKGERFAHASARSVKAGLDGARGDGQRRGDL